jgi:uridylate kinase
MALSAAKCVATRSYAEHRRFVAPCMARFRVIDPFRLPKSSVPVVDGNGNAARDYDAWVEEGAALGHELRRQEEDALGMLSMSPSRAADAMVSLFEWTLDRIENPLPIEDEMTPAEVVKLREENAVALARFWERCDELAAMIASHPARPKSGQQ